MWDRDRSGVFRGGIGYLVAEVGSRGILFALLVGLAAALPVESFAWVSLYVLFANLGALVVGLGTPSSIVRLYFQGPSFAGVLGVTLLATGVSGAVVVALSFFFVEALSMALQIPTDLVIASAVGAPLIALRNSILALRLLLRERPTHIVSTGAAAAIPFFWLGRLFGARTIFIEVFDRIDSRTITGRVVHPVANHFFVQWPEQLALYGRAELLGPVL